MPKSRLVGDWDKVGKSLNAMVSTYNKMGNEPLQECAELYRDAVISNIENQTIRFRKLNVNYAAKKLSMGYGSKILIATHSYVEGIKIHEVRRVGEKMTVFVGASYDEIHEPSGLSMGALGEVHEYGSNDGRIPPRPHYRPSWEKVLPKVKAIWLKYARETYTFNRK